MQRFQLLQQVLLIAINGKLMTVLIGHLYRMMVITVAQQLRS